MASEYQFLYYQNLHPEWRYKLDLFYSTADISNPNNCDQGAGYGCESYYYNPVITKSEVIYIVAAIFGVVLVIVVPSVIIYCYRRQHGLNRRWQERRLKDGAPNTAATSLNGSLRSVPVSSRPWQSDISKQPFASIKKSPTSSRRWSRPPTDDDESVFDGMLLSMNNNNTQFQSLILHFSLRLNLMK